jgi:hypothetical protein
MSGFIAVELPSGLPLRAGQRARQSLRSRRSFRQTALHARRRGALHFVARRAVAVAQNASAVAVAAVICVSICEKSVVS